MLHKLFKMPKRHVGLDIGTGGIKLVELEGRTAKPRLKVWAGAPLPQGIYREGQIGDGRALSDRIRELVAKSGVSTTYCVSCMEGQHVFNRFINMPAMSKEEVLEAIKWDAEKYLPYAPEDCYLDAVILKGAPGVQEMKVLLVAAGRKIVDAHAAVLQQAGLQPVAIDFGALALGRALLDGSAQKNRVILDLGAGSTKMSFFKGAIIAFSHTIPFGGNHITRLLQDELGLSWEEAENYKARQTDLLAGRGEDLTEVENMRKLLRLAVGDVKREINRSLAYYQSRNREEPLSQMIFTGGGSLLPGLKEMLLADLDLQPVVADLSRTVAYGPGFAKTSLQSLSPLFGTALGLALWEGKA
ncbi:MAG TPA: type IV pilus assembly protein PilM [Negativicutes bacterium]|nr:type IV pilus assembly protein PilM [Negativicutes bacterium]